jgi:hypothetical protein
MSVRFIISNLINSEFGQNKEPNPSRLKKMMKKEEAVEEEQ